MKQYSQFTFSYTISVTCIKKSWICFFYITMCCVSWINQNLSYIKRINCPIKVIILIDYIKSKYIFITCIKAVFALLMKINSNNIDFQNGNLDQKLFSVKTCECT